MFAYPETGGKTSHISLFEMPLTASIHLIPSTAGCSLSRVEKGRRELSRSIAEAVTPADDRP
jgi:hypothetical protein